MAAEATSTNVSEHLWGMATTSEESAVALAESLKRLEIVESMRRVEAFHEFEREFDPTPNDLSPVPSALALFLFFLVIYLATLTGFSKSPARFAHTHHHTPTKCGSLGTSAPPPRQLTNSARAAFLPCDCALANIQIR
eukprot:7383654-Prymnesium_polylepis.2